MERKNFKCQNAVAALADGEPATATSWNTRATGSTKQLATEREQGTSDDVAAVGARGLYDPFRCDPTRIYNAKALPPVPYCALPHSSLRSAGASHHTLAPVAVSIRKGDVERERRAG